VHGVITLSLMWPCIGQVRPTSIPLVHAVITPVVDVEAAVALRSVVTPAPNKRQIVGGLVRCVATPAQLLQFNMLQLMLLEFSSLMAC
jgi:hypothetical protein